MAKKSITRHNEKCDHLDNINDVYAFEPEPAKKRKVWENFYIPKKLSMLQFFYRKLFYLEFFYNH